MKLVGFLQNSSDLFETDLRMKMSCQRHVVGAPSCEEMNFAARLPFHVGADYSYVG